jgi:hypothetical protein
MSIKDELRKYLDSIAIEDLRTHHEKIIFRFIEHMHLDERYALVEKQESKAEPEWWICPKAGNCQRYEICPHREPHRHYHRCSITSKLCPACVPWTEEKPVNVTPESTAKPFDDKAWLEIFKAALNGINASGKNTTNGIIPDLAAKQADKGLAELEKRRAGK